MATRTIVRMFDDRDHALMAVRDLESAGFTQDEVSVMAAGGTPGTSSGADVADTPDSASGAGMGATLGTLLGGGAGLLAGIGAMAIPGLGPIVAAGWLAATLTGGVAGAAAGGLLGSLVGSGVEEREAHVYAEGVRRGGTLVSVRGEEARVVEAERIMARHQTVDVPAREAQYRAAGWSGYATEGSGQVTPRADDDGRTIPRQPDGAPGNPPGTEASRGVDKALGTNISGAHPENERRRS